MPTDQRRWLPGLSRSVRPRVWPRPQARRDHQGVPQLAAAIRSVRDSRHQAQADAWGNRGSFDMHQSRRAKQLDDPNLYEAVLPADDWLFAKDREPRGSRELAHGLFQFLLAAR